MVAAAAVVVAVFSIFFTLLLGKTTGRTDDGHTLSHSVVSKCVLSISPPSQLSRRGGACEGVLALTKRKQLGWTWRSIKLRRNSFYFFLLSKTLFSCIQFTVGFFSPISVCFRGWYHIFVTLILFYFYLTPYVPYLYFYFGLFRRTTVCKIFEVLRTNAQAKTQFVTLMSYRLNFRTIARGIFSCHITISCNHTYTLHTERERESDCETFSHVDPQMEK